MPENRKVWVAVMKPTEPLVYIADEGKNTLYYGITSRNVFMIADNHWRVMQIISTPERT